MWRGKAYAIGAFRNPLGRPNSPGMLCATFLGRLNERKPMSRTLGRKRRAKRRERRAKPDEVHDLALAGFAESGNDRAVDFMREKNGHRKKPMEPPWISAD
jgi:hypothetical protein